MRKYRVIKIIVALTLTVAIVLCSSVFVSAYYPLWSCYSSDWVVQTDSVYSATYPIEPSVMQGFDNSVYSYDELNGETYYLSKFWNDDYVYITENVITLPDYPTDIESYSEFGYTSVSDYYGVIIYRSGYNFYLDIVHNCNYVYLYDNSYLAYDVEDCTGEILGFKLSYPYTEWEHYFTYSYYQEFYDVSLNILNVDEIVYSDFEIYSDDLETLFYEFPDEDEGDEVFDGTCVLEYENPLTVLSGSLTCDITADEFELLSRSVSAFILENVGFITCTIVDYMDLTYSMSIYQGDVLFDTIYLSKYNYNSTDDESYIDVGQCFIDSDMYILDFQTSDLTDSDINIVFNYDFAATGFCLYFPGSIELVEYASFEEQEQHKEVINKLDDVIDSVNNGFDSIMNAEIGLEEIVIDMSPIDDYVAEQDEIINGIYEDTDKLLEDNMPDGYEDYNDYLEDNIGYFNKNLQKAFAFIQKLFDSLVDVTGQSYLILFCLTFGFAMYVIGRKLS